MSLAKLLGLSKKTSAYSVNHDGALVLDRAALLRSGKMDAQFKAAETLHARQQAEQLAERERSVESVGRDCRQLPR